MLDTLVASSPNQTITVEYRVKPGERAVQPRENCVRIAGARVLDSLNTNTVGVLHVGKDASLAAVVNERASWLAPGALVLTHEEHRDDALDLAARLWLSPPAPVDGYSGLYFSHHLGR